MEFAVRSALRPSREAPLLLLSSRPIVLHAIDWAFLPGSPSLPPAPRASPSPGRHPADAELEPREAAADREADPTASGGCGGSGTTGSRSSRRARPSSCGFRRAGLSAILVGNTATTDERIFRPLPERRIRFDAVYDARLSALQAPRARGRGAEPGADHLSVQRDGGSRLPGRHRADRRPAPTSSTAIPRRTPIAVSRRRR